jgi:putative acetyltransferase
MQTFIRHVQPEDCAAVHELFVSAHVVKGTMRLPYQSPAYTAKRIEPSDEVMKLVACVDERVVGYAELITHPNAPRHRHAGEINIIVVHADWQGKGVGAALMGALLDLADNWLQLSRVSLVVWESNAPAQRLYCKCGFLVEGTLCRYVFREGGYEDACLMARVRG